MVAKIPLKFTLKRDDFKNILRGMPPDPLDWACFACNHCAPPQSNYKYVC